MPGVPFGQPGPGVLSRLISTGTADFAAEFWGRRALLSRAEDLPGDVAFDDLLNADSIDELLSVHGLRTPFLRVANGGNTLPDRTFTAPAGVGAGIADQVSDDRLTRLFADGSTLVLQALHRSCPPVLEFSQSLAAELGHPVQANAYITPPQNQGFGHHYDVHDVFVLQIEGEKRWSIHAPVLDSPLRDQPWTDRRAAVERRAAEPPVIEAVLRPGDCLYLPRGFLHAAQALGGISTHLTIGVHVWTGYALAERMVQQAIRAVADQPPIRASLPLGLEFIDGALADDLEAVRRALVEAVERVDPRVLMTELRRADRATSRAAPIGPMAQFRAAERLDACSVLAVRAHLAARVERRLDGTAVLRSRADDLSLDLDEVTPVQSLLLGESMTAGELGMNLARRLLLAGLAVVADSATPAQ